MAGTDDGKREVAVTTGALSIVKSNTKNVGIQLPELISNILTVHIQIALPVPSRQGNSTFISLK